jgi:hypothetical protein
MLQLSTTQSQFGSEMVACRSTLVLQLPDAISDRLVGLGRLLTDEMF